MILIDFWMPTIVKNIFDVGVYQKVALRLRSESLKLIGSAMFGATLNLHGYTYQTTVIFGKLKDGTVVNSLA